MPENQRSIIDHKNGSPVAEAYRAFRTNILYSKIDGELKTIVFTSSGPGEGKSFVAANIAVTLAQSGKKVIVVDADLRKPSQHLIFQGGHFGLTNALHGEKPVNEVIQKTKLKNLWLVSSGPLPPNPSELLGSLKMKEFIEKLKKRADYVIFDTPPVIPVTDACVLAPLADGVVLVLGAGMVRPEMAEKAKTLIQNVQGMVLGVVINRVKSDDARTYNQYYTQIG